MIHTTGFVASGFCKRFVVPASLATPLLLASACGTVSDNAEHRSAMGASAGLAIGMIGGPIGAIVGASIGIGVAHLTVPDEEKPQ